MIDRKHDMHCTNSSDDKENNKNCDNPTEMTGKNKLLTLKHKGLHFEPLIDVLILTLDRNWPENYYYNILNNVYEVQKIYLVENMSTALEFYSKIY